MNVDTYIMRSRSSAAVFACGPSLVELRAGAILEQTARLTRGRCIGYVLPFSISFRGLVQLSSGGFFFLVFLFVISLCVSAL